MSGKVIGTHSGPFHGDDVMACAILKLHPDYRDGEVVRSREKETLDKCDIVVDVGGRFSHEERRYDHHQREFHLTMDQLSDGEINKETKLSSAGLVFYYYGKEVIRDTLHRLELDGEKDTIKIDWIWKRMYIGFINEIDYIDNKGSGGQLIKTGYSSRVGWLNPSWEDDAPDYNKSFHQALQLARGEFIDILKLTESGWRAKEALKEQVLRRREKHKSGCVLILDKYIQWPGILGEVLKDIETQKKEKKKIVIKYVISKNDEGSRPFTVTVTVLKNQEQFFFPESWRGLPDEELQRALCRSGCLVSSPIYGVPNSGHKAFTDTMEDALAIVDFMLERSFTGTKK